jgi:GT2 family glycosyltransferase
MSDPSAVSAPIDGEAPVREAHPPERTSVAVVVVNYNTVGHLDACLQSVRREGPAETIVIDNGSTDGSIELVVRSYPEARIIIDPTNPGFGSAANHAIAAASSPYVLLLNADTVLRPGAIAGITRYLDDNPEVAVLGPRLLNLDGSLQPSTFFFPTPLMVFLAETRIGYIARYVPGFRDFYLRTWAHDRPRRVPWVRGAAMGIRRIAFDDVGGFDREYAMYFEEVDLCFRLGSNGWLTHFAPVADIVHAHGASTTQRAAEMRVLYYESLHRFYHRYYGVAWRKRMSAVVRWTVAFALTRDWLRWKLAFDHRRRRDLQESVAAWKRILRARDAE